LQRGGSVRWQQAAPENGPALRSSIGRVPNQYSNALREAIFDDADDDEYEDDYGKEFWGEAWFYSSSAGFDSALIIRIREIAAVTRQKPSQR
jgi:hypothetical protein